MIYTLRRWAEHALIAWRRSRPGRPDTPADYVDVVHDRIRKRLVAEAEYARVANRESAAAPAQTIATAPDHRGTLASLRKE